MLQVNTKYREFVSLSYLELDNQTLLCREAIPDCLESNFRRYRSDYQKTLCKNCVDLHKIHRRIYRLMFQALFCNPHRCLFCLTTCYYRGSFVRIAENRKIRGICFGENIFQLSRKTKTNWTFTLSQSILLDSKATPHYIFDITKAV